MAISLQSAPLLSRKPPSLRWLGSFRVAIVACLLTLLPGYFWGRRLEEARRFAAWKQQRSKDGIRHQPGAAETLLTRIDPTTPAEPGRVHWNERQVGELLTEHFEPAYWDWARRARGRRFLGVMLEVRDIP